MATVPLREFASVTLDANGDGTAQLGISSARETWHPTNVSVRVSTANLDASCSVYVGPEPQAAYFRDRTITGSSGDSTSDIIDDIRGGVYLWAAWQGGDAGATATITVTGTKDI